MNLDINTVITALSLLVSAALAFGALRKKVDTNDAEVKSLKEELHELREVVVELRLTVMQLSVLVNSNKPQDFNR